MTVRMIVEESAELSDIVEDGVCGMYSRCRFASIRNTFRGVCGAECG